MTDPDNRPVLVLGATGAQGGAALRHLLANGIPARALVRDAAKAQHLVAAGATLAVGSFEDKAALVAACAGARAVFSMQNAPAGPDPDTERRDGRTIVDAAREAGVPQMIHTSVSGAGAFHRAMVDWGTGRWNENYWESKADVEAMVRDAGFAFYTILKPAFMMENFTLPKAMFMFPDLVDDGLVSALQPATRLVMVSAETVGQAAAAAAGDPERFNRAELELGGDSLTMADVAATLSAATGRTITATAMSPDEVIARGQFPGWVNSQDWMNYVGYPARPGDAQPYGLQPTNLADWARAHAAEIAHR